MFQIDNILFDTAECLATIKNVAVRNHISDGFPERPRFGFQQIKNDYNAKNYKDFFIQRKQYNKNSGAFPDRVFNYSDEFYSRMDKSQPFVVDFFLDLQREFTDLTIEELQILNESIKRLSETIKTFIPQEEILKKMRNENEFNREMGGISPYYRIAQDRFLKKLDSDMLNAITSFEGFQGIPYDDWLIDPVSKQKKKLLYLAQKAILNSGNFRFRMIGQISYQGDYPYTNWLQNIPDIMLDYTNCYADMINKLIKVKERSEMTLVKKANKAAKKANKKDIMEIPREAFFNMGKTLQEEHERAEYEEEDIIPREAFFNMGKTLQEEHEQAEKNENISKGGKKRKSLKTKRKRKRNNKTRKNNKNRN